MRGVIRGKKQAARDISGRHAVTHVWDAGEPRLLVCEARELASDEKTKQQQQQQQRDAHHNQHISLTKATMSETVRGCYSLSACCVQLLVTE